MRQFNRKSDTILWYSKGKKWTFNKNKMRIPYKDPMQRPRKAFDTGDAFNPKEIQAMRKRGKVLENWWTDIAIAARSKKEWLGYPTQKPLKLLDRIIQASSNKGDVILDPFCGCGTALHSAANNKRQFVGIDISVFSVYSVTKERMRDKCGIEVPIYGIPTNMAGARLLAKQDKFAFESWAGEVLNFGNIGILSNKIQRCDGGIDGKGKLLGETEDGKDEVIVQVKGGGFTINDVKAFKETIQSKKRVAAGIFIPSTARDGRTEWKRLRALAAFLECRMRNLIGIIE